MQQEARPHGKHHSRASLSLGLIASGGRWNPPASIQLRFGSDVPNGAACQTREQLSQGHSFLTFTLPSRFSSTSNIASSPALRQSAVTWMRSNLRRPRVENRSRKAGLRTFWRESLVTSEKVISPDLDRAMGSNSSMRFLTATFKFWIVTDIAQLLPPASKIWVYP